MAAFGARKSLSVMWLISLTVLALSPAALAAGSSLSTPSQVVSVSVSAGSSLAVVSPPRSSLALLSVQGSEYSASLDRVVSGFSYAVNGVPVPGQNLAGGEEFSFTPKNASFYSVDLNVTSTSATFALVTLGAPSEALVKNVTSAGSFELRLLVTATQSPAQPSGWNLLFGLTGIGLGGLSLTSEDGVILVSALLVVLFVAGARFSRRFADAGILLLLVLGFAILGVVIESLAILVYVASFVMIRSYHDMKSRNSDPSEGEDG